MNLPVTELLKLIVFDGTLLGWDIRTASYKRAKLERGNY